MRGYIFVVVVLSVLLPLTAGNLRAEVVEGLRHHHLLHVAQLHRGYENQVKILLTFN